MAGSSNIGRIVTIFRGAYDNTKKYTQLDEVSYNNDYYRVIFGTNPPIGTLPSNTAYWNLIFSIEPMVRSYYETVTENAQDFNKHYLGAKAEEPETDNNGDDLEDGALYFNSDEQRLAVFTGGAWVPLVQDFGDIVPSSRAVTTGAGLQGGGDLTTNRVISLTPAAQASLLKADSSVQTSRVIGVGPGLQGGGTLDNDLVIGLDVNTVASLGKADTAVQPNRKIIQGTGLVVSGDGTLANDLTIALSTAVQNSLAKADSVGTLGTQSASNVNITGGAASGLSITGGTINNATITGGSIGGITDLAVADGGTGASTPAAARTNLGLGSIATQSAGGVSITGGSITGIDDIAVVDGGTGASTPSAARTNLGLAIGSDVQAYNARLATIAATPGAAGAFYRWTSTTTAEMQAIVGTVTQSAGVPTGALIERGENANGAYVRFADGTQICWKSFSTSIPINNANGSLFYSVSQGGGNFPAAFISSVVAPKPNINSSSGLVWACGNSNPTLSAWPGYYLMAATSLTNTVYSMWLVAFGRWY